MLKISSASEGKFAACPAEIPQPFPEFADKLYRVGPFLGIMGRNMISIAIVAAIGLFLLSGSLRKREKQEMKRLQRTLYTL